MLPALANRFFTTSATWETYLSPCVDVYLRLSWVSTLLEKHPKAHPLFIQGHLSPQSLGSSGFPGLLLISFPNPALLHRPLETAAGQMTVLADG